MLCVCNTQFLKSECDPWHLHFRISSTKSWCDMVSMAHPHPVTISTDGVEEPLRYWKEGRSSLYINTEMRAHQTDNAAVAGFLVIPAQPNLLQIPPFKSHESESNLKTRKGSTNNFWWQVQPHHNVKQIFAQTVLCYQYIVLQTLIHAVECSSDNTDNAPTYRMVTSVKAVDVPLLYIMQANVKWQALNAERFSQFSTR